jgi:GYF domain 2
MDRAEARFAWHLKRGQKIYSSISHRELRLLAELGHLRPDDLLWRPGLGSWTSVSSVPGVPPLDSQTKQWDLTKIGALFWTRMSAPFLAASNDFCRLILSTRQHAPAIKARLQLAYNRVASHWTAFNLIGVLRHVRPEGIAAVLLVMAVFVGALDFAMKSSSATANKAQIANSVAPKFQDRPSTAGPRALWTNPSQLKPALHLTEAEVFNVSNGHPTGGFALASNQTSESKTESVAQALSPSLVFQSVAGTEAVPLPTKKPDRSFLKEAQPNAATLKRIAQRPRGREPKSIRFGIIGYNYNPQQ